MTLKGLLATSDGGVSQKILHRFWHFFRKVLVKTADPLVAFEVAGFKILIPLSSNLPLHSKLLPQYSTNIGRIVRRVAGKYPNLTTIDIGANVGDTAALMRSETSAPILCIEGEKRFFRILQQNTPVLGTNVVLERCFVGDESGFSAARVDSHRGTARIVQSESGTEIRFKTLAQILDEHPQFDGAKFIKIDTDGFDCRIIKGNANLLKRLKPVLFFEYDPYLFKAAGDDGFKVFEVLRQAGYSHAMIYENVGDYLLMTELGNESLLEEIHSFYKGRYEQRYCDICVFHAEDADLCRELRKTELQFFEKFRDKARN